MDAISHPGSSIENSNKASATASIRSRVNAGGKTGHWAAQKLATLMILEQPPVDDLGETIQLRPPDRRCSPIPRRNRKAHDLLHAVARNPKITRRSPLAHAVSTGKTHLPIQIHGENTPALPVARKGQSGRLLRRPQRNYPAATVEDFCTDGLTSTYIGATAATYAALSSYTNVASKTVSINPD